MLLLMCVSHKRFKKSYGKVCNINDSFIDSFLIVFMNILPSISKFFFFCILFLALAKRFWIIIYHTRFCILEQKIINFKKSDEKSPILDPLEWNTLLKIENAHKSVTICFGRKSLDYTPMKNGVQCQSNKSNLTLFWAITRKNKLHLYFIYKMFFF